MVSLEAMSQWECVIEVWIAFLFNPKVCDIVVNSVRKTKKTKN